MAGELTTRPLHPGKGLMSAPIMEKWKGINQKQKGLDHRVALPGSDSLKASYSRRPALIWRAGARDLIILH